MNKEKIAFTADSGDDYDIHFNYGFNEVTGEIRLINWIAKYADSNMTVKEKFNNSTKKEIETHLLNYLDERQDADAYLDDVREREMGVDELINRYGWK